MRILKSILNADDADLADKSGFRGNKMNNFIRENPYNPRHPCSKTQDNHKS